MMSFPCQSTWVSWVAITYWFGRRLMLESSRCCEFKSQHLIPNGLLSHLPLCCKMFCFKSLKIKLIRDPFKKYVLCRVEVFLTPICIPLIYFCINYFSLKIVYIVMPTKVRFLLRFPHLNICLEKSQCLLAIAFSLSSFSHLLTFYLYLSL